MHHCIAYPSSYVSLTSTISITLLHLDIRFREQFHPNRSSLQLVKSFHQDLVINHRVAS